jgi:uncharacterized damage-inducible protein DinB
MTLRQFLIDRREAESGAFHRILNALPRDQFDYRPHDRSPSARELVWTLTNETRGCCNLIDSGHLDWRPQPPPGDAGQILSEFQRSYTALSGRVATLDQDAWQRPVQFRVQGELKREAPLGELLWFLFFDAIHHRGQLSTYIRPMGGKVPSIYGPSGDDPGR